MPDRTSSSHFKGYTSPNYTMVPDELFDEQLPDLSGAELKALLYIIRRTFGFKRDSDSISLNQLLSGITTRKGTRLDRGTGLSRSTLVAALKSLAEKRIIIVEQRCSPQKGNEPTNYRLNLLYTLVRKSDQGESENRTSLVRKPNPQDTVRQDRDISNTRERAHGQKNSKPVLRPAMIGATTGSPSGLEGIDVTLQRRPRHRPVFSTDDRQVLLAYIADFARELNDQAALTVSTARALNLLHRSGLPREAFLQRMFEARAVTKDRSASPPGVVAASPTSSPSIKRKMAFFFAVLEDLLGLREEAPSGSQE